MIDKYRALIDFIKSRADAPMVWGTNDCCMFAADTVLAQTGVDPLEWLRGAYSTEDGAAEVLKRGGGLARMVTAQLGAARPLVTTARRGDVVLFESGNGPALGVCVGDKFAAIRPVGGLGYFSMRHAITAWRVE